MYVERVHVYTHQFKFEKIYVNFEIFNFLKLHLLGVQLIWRMPSQKCAWIVYRFPSILSLSRNSVGKSQNCRYSERYSQQLKKQQWVCDARDWSSVNLPKLILNFNQCIYHYSWVYFGRLCPEHTTSHTNFWSYAPVYHQFSVECKNSCN